MQLLADCALEQVLKALSGNDDIDRAFLRLDIHTRDEALLLGMTTLEATCRVEDIVHDVDGNLRATRSLIEGIDGNVKEIEGVTHYGTQQHLSIFLPLSTPFPVILYFATTALTQEFKRLSFRHPIVDQSLILKDEICLQGTRRETNFNYGCLLRIPPLIGLKHVKQGHPRRHGLLKA